MTAPLPPTRLAARLRTAGEAVLLFLAAAPAWAFASIEPVWTCAVAVGIAVLVGLWAAHAIVTSEFRFRADAVSIALGGLVLWSAVQLVPLPLGVVRILSPGAAMVHEDFLPAVAETLPGEPPGAPRASVLTLSVEPAATRWCAVRVTAVLLVYAAARNWLASPAAFRRLAWVAASNGLALAVVALGQFFSSPRNTVYWTLPIGDSVFGPFINRNHYCDFLAGCLGLGVGLMLALRTVRPGQYEQESATYPPTFADRLAAPFRYLDQPWPLAAAGAVALMAVSVLFSLSRGGVLGLAVAALGCGLLARRKKSENGASQAGDVGGWAMAGVAVVAVALTAWFGWEPVRARFATLFTSTGDDRTKLWGESLRAVSGFWLTGSGNGTFIRVETLGRRDGSPDLSNDHAHNEYIEALVEGGVVRLGLTLWLVVGVLWTVGRGFHAWRSQPSGPLLLGAWFGLAAVAAHAVTDFGIHLPAVAVFAAILAGYAMGVSGNETPRARKKVRIRKKATAEPPPVTAAAAPAPAAPEPPRGRPEVAVLFAVVAAAVAWDTFGRARGMPDDAATWFARAQAHLASGTPGDTRAALVALRTARDRCPLFPEAQFRLGLFARSFQSSDPPVTYLDRARRLLAVDADVWYATGLEALRNGDEATAWSDFHRSLILSEKRFEAIVVEAGARLDSHTLAARVLPDDPRLLWAAANQLYPNVGAQRVERLPLLERAAKEQPGGVRGSLTATARALGELGRTAEAEAVWRRALSLAPSARAEFAEWLEEEELYAMAVAEWRLLADASPFDDSYRQRLSAAKHAAALQAEIGK